MNPKTLQTALQDIPLGGFRYYEQISSTNDMALKWGEEGGLDLSIVIADEQLAGRGRDGRRWQTPPESALAFSLVLLPSIEEKKNISLFNGLGALALVMALKENYAIEAKIKWPNDVLIDGKKIAGILVETNWLGDNIQSIVLGMGVNVHAGSVPDDVIFPATSLEKIRPDRFLQSTPPVSKGQKPVRSLLLRQILDKLIEYRPSLGSGDLHSVWEENLAFKGKQVQIQGRDGQVIQEGKILGINKDGSLRLDTHPSIHFGDVRLRPL